ncbi:HAD-IA family hydrolase [Streptomyces olivaceus]|uniref:HAD-IA family hydrolase n=1 Tax=Streptomyces olivaceus TaxID=47716 RepID=UPI001CC9DBC3|nr:HAD-IA family hydrolase [Streptomyces olivaceus]MBZ6285790.1 HAD-IA family hydrolase [Streptomyces olivaceus]
MQSGISLAPGLIGTPFTHPKRVVVFDLDGVIVDSFAVMREAFSLAYAEVVGDGDAPFEEYERHLGRYFPDIMRIMGLPLEMEEPFVRESYRLAGRVRLFPGVTPLLRELRERGFRTAIATGKAGDRARHLLETLEVLPYFDHVLGSDEVARAKPAPDIVLRALELLRSRPEEAMMVGDAVTDIGAARAAGVDAVAALWGESDATELLASGPDAAFRRPADLLAVCPPVTDAA